LFDVLAVALRAFDLLVLVVLLEALMLGELRVTLHALVLIIWHGSPPW
jgi:hypothetical protein